MTRARIDKHGRIVIPTSFRERLNIQVGDSLVLRVEGDELRITSLEVSINRAQAIVRKHVKPGTSLVDEFIAERRARSI